MFPRERLKGTEEGCSKSAARAESAPGVDGADPVDASNRLSSDGIKDVEELVSSGSGAEPCALIITTGK